MDRIENKWLYVTIATVLVAMTLLAGCGKSSSTDKSSSADKSESPTANTNVFVENVSAEVSKSSDTTEPKLVDNIVVMQSENTEPTTVVF